MPTVRAATPAPPVASPPRPSFLRGLAVLPAVGPFPLVTFDTLLKHSKEPAPRPSKTIIDLLGEPPEHIISRPPRNLTKYALAGLEDFPFAYSEPIAEQCEQVRELRDKQGNLSEPRWYAALGVLAFCEDGERYAHEWSSGDPRYTERETQERLDRARQLSGATTCQRFFNLNRKVCERNRGGRPKRLASRPGTSP